MANKQNMSNKIKKAIISLSDKSDIKLILNTLKKYKVHLISSGGTSKEIRCDEFINSFNDHRIAMSFLISGVRSENCVRVKNCKNIETSFPDFKDIMNSIGMKIDDEN